MKLTLTKLIRKSTDRDGKPFLTRDGRNSERLAVQTEEHGTIWVGGFSGAWNFGWKVGDVVEAEVVQNGQYLNLIKPDPLKQILVRLDKLEDAMFGAAQVNKTPDPLEAPRRRVEQEEVERAVKEDDLPF